MGNHHIDCDYCGLDTRGLSGVKGCYSQAEAQNCSHYKPATRSNEPLQACPPATAEHGAEIRELSEIHRRIADAARSVKEAQRQNDIAYAIEPRGSYRQQKMHQTHGALEAARSEHTAAVTALIDAVGALSPHQGPETGRQGAGREGEGRVPAAPGYSGDAPSPQAVSASGEYPSRETALVAQVADQCRVVAHLATALAAVHSDYVKLAEAPAFAYLLRHVGERSAALMETLGDVLNDMDANSADDAWTIPIFSRAQQIFPRRASDEHPTGEDGASRLRAEPASAVHAVDAPCVPSPTDAKTGEV